MPVIWWLALAEHDHDAELENPDVTFHAGKVEEFKRLSAECLDEDESECVVVERFRDSDALILHVGVARAPGTA